MKTIRNKNLNFDRIIYCTTQLIKTVKEDIVFNIFFVVFGTLERPHVVLPGPKLQSNF